VIVWCDVQRQVACLPVGYALEVLRRLRADTGWKTAGVVVGRPESWSLFGGVTGRYGPSLRDQVTLDPAQTSHFFQVLSDREGMLQEMYDQQRALAAKKLGEVHRILLALATSQPARTDEARTSSAG
jgi:hypothetical protein